jgi:thiosulfate/3-mercaptopyruvate sulfurtransferase
VNEFPTAEAMARSFTSLVIPRESRIVLYGDDPGLFAARAWVALDLMGHGERAALLDGGLAAWRTGGRPLESGHIALPAIHIPFVPNLQPQRLVDAAWVRAHLGDSSVLLVDARPADQFAGAEPPCRPGAVPCTVIPEGRRGHLPGARNLFWMDALVSADNPVLKPMHVLHHELWRPLGADAGGVRTVVTYCRSGVQGSHAYFVARYIGYPDVRLYDGAFSEWATLPPAEHPVERGPTHGGGTHRQH